MQIIEFELNRDERKMQREEMLLYALGQWPDLSLSQLAYLLGVSERTCYRYLSSLRGKGITIKRSLSDEVVEVKQRVWKWKIIGGEHEGSGSGEIVRKNGESHPSIDCVR